MELVYFKDLLEENSKPQYGVLQEEDNPGVICLECGNIIEHGDYVILKRVSWRDVKVEEISAVKSVNKYVVCMNDEYVRDAQYLDTKNLSQDEFDDFDYYNCENEELWLDMEPNPFIAIVEAELEKDACKKQLSKKITMNVVYMR